MHRYLTSLFLLLAHLAAFAEIPKTDIYLAAIPRLSDDGSVLYFAWNGDLWMASSQGGIATRIVSHPAEDLWPCLSPDGSQIAYNSNRTGSWQVYIQDLAGGAPRQITQHSEGYTPLEWTADGKAILTNGSRDYFGLDSDRFFLVDVADRQPDELLFDAYGENATMASDGDRVLFCREGTRNLYRKGYRGSMASQIWMYTRSTKKFEPVLMGDVSHRSPLWMPDGKGFYFTSEASGTFNLWSYRFKDQKQEQLTFFEDDGVILPAISRDGSALVFRRGFDFYLFHPGSGKDSEAIHLYTHLDMHDPVDIRRKTQKMWNLDTWGSLSWSDDYKEMVFTAAGDVWVMDKVLQEPIPVHQNGATHETEAVISPQNDAIYYLSDAGGQVDVWMAKKGDPSLPWWRQKGFVRQKLEVNNSSKSELTITPDGKWLGWVENNRLLVLQNPGSGARKELITGLEFKGPQWAPQGRWITASIKDSNDNYDVWLIDSDAEVPPYNISRHPDWDGSAVWSGDGRKLAFIGERGRNKDLDVFYVFLDSEEGKESSRLRKLEQSLNQKRKSTSSEEAIKPEDIHFADLYDRVQRLERDDSRETDAFWNSDSKRLAFISTVNGKRAVYYVEIPDKTNPALLSSTLGYRAEWKGERIHWWVDGHPAMFTGGNNTLYPVSVYNEIHLPEYRQLAFTMMWRVMRDSFYDATFRGKNWNAILTKYRDMAALVPDWTGFRRLVYMMNGELNASHTGFEFNSKMWPDWNPPDQWNVLTGHPGLLFDRDAGGPGVLIKQVLKNGPAEKRGAEIHPGERLIAVDGEPVTASTDLDSVFTGRLEQVRRLKVTDTGGESREVELEPISYTRARELVWETWIDQNRHRVSDLSQGRLAYLHVDRMAMEEFARFEQEVFALTYDKEGLVIDVRNNRGGFTADRMLHILNRPQHAVTRPRGGEPSYPRGYLVFGNYDKPIVVLCNQNTASNGEIFSHAIKELHRGKLVGVPTGGGVISRPVVPILDLGDYYIPRRGWWTLSNLKDMEMNGAMPDIVIWPQPGDIPAGRDEQLNKAVSTLLEDLDAHPAADPILNPYRSP